MKKNVNKFSAILLIFALVLQFGFTWNLDYACAETEKESYIVIAENKETAENIAEEYDTISSTGEALSVNLSEREVNELVSNKDILCVENDFLIKKETDAGWNMVEPNDENWALEAINAENAQSLDTIKVAIIDSGIDYTEDIVVKERKNFIYDDPVTTPLYEDTCGHGTSIASIIAGKGNESNVKGVNQKVEIYSARVLDANKQAPISRVVEAIYWAIEQNVDIINMSFGTQEYSEALKEAVDAAVENGILIVASAGNYEDTRVDYPAAFENVLSVGATNATGEIADFSSKGEKVDLVAPGEAVLAQGNFGEDLILSGTSLSTAYVTGVASCLWNKNIESPATFVTVLLKLSSNNAENHYSGFGMLDYDKALENYNNVEQQFVHIEDAIIEDTLPCNNAENQVLDNTVIHEIEEIALEEIEVEENNIEVDDYSVATVSGSWGKAVHEKYSANSAMKIGAIYADKHDELSGIGANPEFHGYAWHADAGGDLGTGNCNYMANYRYLIKVANAYGNGNGYTAVEQADIKGLKETCFNRMQAGFQAIKEHDLDTSSSGAKKCDYCGNSVNIWNKGNDSLQKAFVMGLAMHVATDTFAHSAFKQNMSGSYAWKRITHTNNAADNVSICPRRVEMAYAAAQNVVSRYNGNRGSYHTCNDFYNSASGAYSELDFRITKMRTFAEAAGYTTTSVLNSFGKLQSTI